MALSILGDTQICEAFLFFSNNWLTVEDGGKEVQEPGDRYTIVDSCWCLALKQYSIAKQYFHQTSFN